MSSNQGNSDSGTLPLTGQIQGKRAAPRLLPLRVSCIALGLALCLPSGTAISQTNPHEILRFGTEVLRVLNKQLPQESGQPQETTPPQAEQTAPQVRTQEPQRPPEGPAAAASRVSRAQVAEAQELLNQLGFDAGPVDGMMGPRTGQAIQAYQRASGLAPTGMPDDEVLASLRVDAAAIAASAPRGSGHASAGTGNEEPMREPPAVGPDPLLGLWSGEFVCARSTLSVKVAIVDAFGGRHALVQVLDEARQRTRNRIYAVPDEAPGESVDLQWLGGFVGKHRFTLHPVAGSGRLVADHEGCKEMQFTRVQVPDQGGDQDPVPGMWTGQFEACRRGMLSARMDVISTFPGEYLVDAEYVEEPPAGRTLASRDLGRKLFFGVRESGSEVISLQEIARLETRRNGEPVGHGSAIRQIELEYDAAQRALNGRTDGCEYGEFAKEGSQEEMMAATVAAPAGQPPVDFAGEWEGYAKCGGSSDTPVILELEPFGSGRIRGSIEYADSGAVTHGVVRQSVLGEPRADGGSYDFVIERTLPGGRGPAPAEFTLRPDVGGSGIVATYDGAPCSSLQLARVTPDSISRRPGVALPADGGPFFASRRPRERCEAVAAWLERVKDEYPGLDIRRTMLSQVYPKVAVLFADDDFVPVFGAPFDRMTDGQRREILREFGALCKRDAFLRERVEGFSVVEKAFLQTLERPSTNFGLPAIYALIREARRLRAAVRSTLGGLPPEAGLDQAVETLTPLQQQIENGVAYLWPSERQAALEEIRSRLGAYALAAAEADLERIAAIEEPFERLEALTAVHGGRTDYSKHLLPEQRSDLQGRILDEERRIADSLVGPMLADLEAVAVDETALVKIDALHRQIAPALTLFIDDIAGAYRTRIGRKRQDAFEALVEAKLAELKTYEPGRSGLAESAAWPARFAALFEGFEESPIYMDAMEKFRLARGELLFDSLPAFQAELQQAGATGADAADIDRILAAYLSWQDDPALEASLLYEMDALVAGGTGMGSRAGAGTSEIEPETGVVAREAVSPPVGAGGADTFGRSPDGGRIQQAAPAAVPPSSEPPVGARIAVPPSLESPDHATVAAPPSLEGVAGKVTEESEAAVPLTWPQMALLAIQHLSGAVSDEQLIEITRRQIHREQGRWRMIDKALTEHEKRPFLNRRRPAFVFEWQRLEEHEDPARWSVLNVLIGPEPDWSFVKAQPGWDDQSEAIVEAFVFSRDDIEERDPDFVARELAPVTMRLLEAAASQAPSEYHISARLPDVAYDFEAGAIRFRAGERGPFREEIELFAAPRSPVFLAEADWNRNLPAGTLLPESAGSAALYETSQAVPAAPDRGAPGYRVERDQAPSVVLRQSFRVDSRLWRSTRTLAFDRSLKLSAIPMDAALAEPLLRDLQVGQSLQARISFKPDRVERSEYVTQSLHLAANVLFVNLTGVDILDQNGRVVATLNPELFPTVGQAEAVKTAKEDAAFQERAAGLSVHDVAGVRLEMPFDEAEAIVRGRMDVGLVVEYDKPAIPPRPFHDLMGFYSVDGSESIFLYKGSSESNELVAVARTITLPAGLEMQAVKQELKAKYGSEPESEHQMLLRWTASRVPARCRVTISVNRTFGLRVLDGSRQGMVPVTRILPEGMPFLTQPISTEKWEGCGPTVQAQISGGRLTVLMYDLAQYARYLADPDSVEAGVEDGAKPPKLDL